MMVRRIVGVSLDDVMLLGLTLLHFRTAMSEQWKLPVYYLGRGKKRNQGEETVSHLERVSMTVHLCEVRRHSVPESRS